MKKDTEPKVAQTIEEEVVNSQTEEDTPKQETETVSADEPIVETVEVNAAEDSQTELKEQKDKYLRLLSDFDNYKRRTSKEKLNIIKQANEKLILKLLGVIDDFERAIANTEQTKADLEAGLKLIHQKLINNLESEGLKRIADPKGQDFDINEHEAISQIPAPKPELAGKVVDEVEKGYFLNEKVIRYSKVITGI